MPVAITKDIFPVKICFNKIST